MGFLRNYRQRRVSLTGSASLATLATIEWFFQGGRNWTQGAYHGWNGKKCLVGAVQSVRAGQLEDARYWIRQAIAELHPAYAWLPVMQIEAFNDTHSFAEVAEVIARAKQLALASMRQSPPSRASAPEILPPPRRPALTHQPHSGPTIELTLSDDSERVPVKRRD
jgi:hypothetical protein